MTFNGDSVILMLVSSLKANKIFRILFLVILSGMTALLMFGCNNQTVVSRVHYFPLESDGKNSDYSAEISVYGEKGLPYTSISTKKISVSIWNKHTKVLYREYVCTAASLEWDVIWKSVDDLNILFFDFAEGVSIFDANYVEQPAKNIMSLHYTVKLSSDEFIEYPVPKNIVRHAKERG